MTTNPQPGGRDGESKPPWAYGRVFPCTVTDELALPGGDSDSTAPAPPAGQDTDERRCGRCGQIPYLHGLPDSTCVYEPTQAEGQDPEQSRDEREAEIVRQWMRPSSQAPEGLCSDPMCWYTLPLVDGLVVAHSGAGTVDPCDGAGRPPITASAGQNTERLRDEIAESARAWLYERAYAELPVTPGELADRFLALPALARLIAERDEARGQVQRVRELDPVEVALGGLAYVIDQMNDPEHTAGT